MLTSKHAGLGGIAIAVLATNSAYAEPFLWLPTSRGFAVTCKWTCPAVDGGTYYHNAIDYGTPTNSEIRAAAGGKIVVLVNVVPQGFPGGGGYGNHVRIRHPNGYETRYAHLLPNTITVRVGDRVEAGQLLGKSDNTGKSTGPHLHFEVRDSQGRRVNPYGDPPNYTNGCGTNALWATCPPTPAPLPDADGDGYTTAQRDCDDSDPDIYPGAPERCNDLDDDCDGRRDEDWLFNHGAQSIGNLCTVGFGICRNNGGWECAPDGLATVCSADPLPRSSPERCNGFDDDCDGQADEDWRTGLATDLGQSCTVDLTCGTQRNGVWTCTPDGRAVICTPTEICNGIDDDCDGTTDANVDSSILAFDPSNCGSCGRRCVATYTDDPEYCVQGHCISFRRCDPDSLCGDLCNARCCIRCGAGGCDYSCSATCRAQCPYNLPSDRRYLTCLCGGCAAFTACP